MAWQVTKNCFHHFALFAGFPMGRVDRFRFWRTLLAEVNVRKTRLWSFFFDMANPWFEV